MLEFSDLLQLTHVQVHLLLILLFKSLSIQTKQQVQLVVQRNEETGTSLMPSIQTYDEDYAAHQLRMNELTASFALYWWFLRDSVAWMFQSLLANSTASPPVPTCAFQTSTPSHALHAVCLNSSLWTVRGILKTSARSILWSAPLRSSSALPLSSVFFSVSEFCREPSSNDLGGPGAASPFPAQSAAQ